MSTHVKSLIAKWNGPDIPVHGTRNSPRVIVVRPERHEAGASSAGHPMTSTPTTPRPAFHAQPHDLPRTPPRAPPKSPASKQESPYFPQAHSVSTSIGVLDSQALLRLVSLEGWMRKLDHTVTEELKAQMSDQEQQLAALKQQLIAQRSDHEQQLAAVKQQLNAERRDFEQQLVAIKQQLNAGRDLEQQLAELSVSLQDRRVGAHPHLQHELPTHLSEKIDELAESLRFPGTTPRKVADGDCPELSRRARVLGTRAQIMHKSLTNSCNISANSRELDAIPASKCVSDHLEAASSERPGSAKDQELAQKHLVAKEACLFSASESASTMGDMSTSRRSEMITRQTQRMPTLLEKRVQAIDHSTPWGLQCLQEGRLDQDVIDGANDNATGQDLQSVEESASTVPVVAYVPPLLVTTSAASSASSAPGANAVAAEAASSEWPGPTEDQEHAKEHLVSSKDSVLSRSESNTTMGTSPSRSEMEPLTQRMLAEVALLEKRTQASDHSTPGGHQCSQERRSDDIFVYGIDDESIGS
eukprot:gnl/TRDRNA2_/TRDRNA2_176192_c4_seq6.p1 gnl/TRDRNA2_/TRDRNA2_176192_c4~~gnl/TRDRNA2_/TRDRNA2_176192_c4_seq6.p1  ORF type:complete len:529 (-),score=65.70 gnl/TRDRNA2_/TRDRNA2_176192_c4_seq6:49-1635(-)